MKKISIIRNGRRDKEVLDFQIPQIPKPKGLKTKHEFRKTEFVSPLFGSDVKDGSILPFRVKPIGDKDKKYDAFRVEPKYTGKNEEIRFGKKFHEFTSFINSQVREKQFGISTYKEDLVKKPIIDEVDNNDLSDKVNESNHLEEFITDISPDAQNYDSFNEEINKNYDSDTEAVVEYTDELEDYGIETTPVNESIDPKISVKANFDKDINSNINPNQYADTLEVNSDEYILPSRDAFRRSHRDKSIAPQWLLDQIEIIDETLKSHAVDGHVENSRKGPTVTRHELKLAPGVNVKRVQGISNNLMMNLSANSLRIEAPVPGKPYVGVEVPNKEQEVVYFGNMIDEPTFSDMSTPLKVVLGEDIDGNSIFLNIESMPHALIAGSTNSGKSILIHVILMSLILKNHPDDVKLLLIDPKMVELMAYNSIPHLIAPVITDADVASNALSWVVEEMDRRYTLFSNTRNRDINSYNKAIKNGEFEAKKLPFIIVIIDELSDLMLVADNEVEIFIQRISQKARAAGIHLIIATQRPTTDIVKGSIKSNISTRIAFKMPAAVDSTTILDGQGAEQLLGRGDMLLKNNDQLIRIQGAYVSSNEVYLVTDYLKDNYGTNYVITLEEIKQIKDRQSIVEDELLESVAYYVAEGVEVSINNVQQSFNIGFSRAQNIITKLEELGIVSASRGTRSREVLMEKNEVRKLFKHRRGDY